MKNKYRIMEVRKHKDVRYLIQVKRWWLPFWHTFFEEYISLTVAKDRLEYLRSPNEKMIVHED